jgi:hypothetical protein
VGEGRHVARGSEAQRLLGGGVVVEQHHDAMRCDAMRCDAM